MSRLENDQTSLVLACSFDWDTRVHESATLPLLCRGLLTTNEGFQMRDCWAFLKSIRTARSQILKFQKSSLLWSKVASLKVFFSGSSGAPWQKNHEVPHLKALISCLKLSSQWEWGSTFKFDFKSSYYTSYRVKRVILREHRCIWLVSKNDICKWFLGKGIW